MKWAKAHKRPATISTDSILWNKFINFAKPGMLGDITPRITEQFKLKCLKDGLKPRSVNECLTRVQAIINHARKLGYYTGSNPVQGIQRFKIEKNPPKSLQKDEIDRILDIAAAHEEQMPFSHSDVDDLNSRIGPLTDI